MADAKQLARIHRVRTLQLGLTRADEARARDRFDNEAALSARIAELAAGVAPVAVASGAFALGAAAHYRDRLQHSAAAAADRVRAAERQAAQAAEATRAAKRDQSAVEKLIARAESVAVLKEVRALEESPPARKRHDPC